MVVGPVGTGAGPLVVVVVSVGVVEEASNPVLGVDPDLFKPNTQATAVPKTATPRIAPMTYGTLDFVLFSLICMFYEFSRGLYLLQGSI